MIQIPFKIQFVSDLHLEMHDRKNTGTIEPGMFVKPGVAEYLALCGDIGYPERPALRTFLAWCSKNWKTVFYIAGNHEYYNHAFSNQSTMEEKESMLEAICSEFPNVHFLQKKSVFLSEYNLRICGTTLWSHIPEEMYFKVLLGRNDYRKILHSSDEEEICNLTPTIIEKIHIEQKIWLEKEIDLAWQAKERVLVLTHHLPTYKLVHEKYEGHSLNCGFASHLDYLLREPVKAWICGHSHTGQRLEINGLVCALNPVGYPGESVPTKDREAIIEIN